VTDDRIFPRRQRSDCDKPPTFCLPDVVVLAGLAGLAFLALKSYSPIIFLIGLALTYIATFVAMFVLPRYW
jgi:hypothetical protein